MCFAKAGAVSRAGQIAALENTIYYPAMMTAHATAFILLAFVALPTFGAAGPLSWPINCRVGENCQLGLPDIDGDGKAADCRRAGYRGHEGTDIGISPAQMSAGIDVYAAADGVVQWVFDGKFDGCPSKHPDCGRPGTPAPGANSGYMVCTSSGPWCRDGKGACYWCFAGGQCGGDPSFRYPGCIRDPIRSFPDRFDNSKARATGQPGPGIREGRQRREVLWASPAFRGLGQYLVRTRGSLVGCLQSEARGVAMAAAGGSVDPLR